MAEFDPDAYLAREEKRKSKTTGFDPDTYLNKTRPETALQTFGRSSASLADSALNALTGTLDYGAYALARAAGRSPEQAQAETTSPKDVIGRAFGVAGTPGYEQAPVRQLGNVIGENLQSGVVEPVASATGLPQQDVSNIVNTAMIGMGPAVPKVAAAVPRTTKAVVGGAADVIGGAAGAFGGDIARPGRAPRPGQTASVRQPIGETYIPANVLEQYRAKQITAEQAQAQALPTSQLPQEALARTGGTVPFQGQGLRAFGEKIGQDYRNPYKLGAEVAGDILLGGMPTAARLGYKAYQGIQGARAATQLEKYGFTPLTAAEAQAFKNMPSPGPVAPNNPAFTQALTPNYPPALPAPTPASVIPMGTAPRQVNIEGQSYQLPYQIDTTNSMPTGPAQVAQQAAAAKIQSAVPGQTVQEIAAAKIQQTPEQIAKQQAILDQIRARGAQTDTNNAAKMEAARQQDLAAQQARWAAAGVKLPEGTPVAPVAPTAPQPASVSNTLSSMRDRLQPLTAEQQAAADAYNAKTPKEKAAQTRAENKAKSVAETPAPVVKSSMTENYHGKVPVMGEAYYQHYTSGGKTPNELKYSSGTLAEKLYNKVKKDPSSLTKQDLIDWATYDQNIQPDFTVKNPTKKNPNPPTEQELVANASKRLADSLIKNYELVQSQTSFGRPELVGKSTKEAAAIDKKRLQDMRNENLKQEIQKLRQKKVEWDKMSDKEKEKFLKNGGYNPYNITLGEQ